MDHDGLFKNSFSPILPPWWIAVRKPEFLDKEMRVYEENLETISVQERQVVMQYTNEWIEQGIERGRREGSEKSSRRGLKCLLELKFAQAAAPLVARLPELGLEILESLQDALESGADLRQLERLVP